MMSSLLEEIVAEVKLNNPQASAEEVSEAMVRFIEQDILPAALRKMRTPEPISPLQRWREKEMLKRVKKKRREAARIRMEESRQLLLEFEYVKHKLVRIHMDTSSLAPDLFHRDIADSLRRRTISVGTIPTTENLFLKKDGIPSIEPEPVRNKREELSKLMPYTPVPRKEVKEPQIFLIDEIVQEKITSDPIFAENLGVIERVARTYATVSPFKMDFFVYFRTDVEIPDWEKTILSVQVSELDFDKKMKLWDEFDAVIRKEIQQRIKIASRLEKERLEEMNRTLFTRIELA